MQNRGEVHDTETMFFVPSMSADFHFVPLNLIALPLMSTAIQNLEEGHETQFKE
jgi:hypothetical protein